MAEVVVTAPKVVVLVMMVMMAPLLLEVWQVWEQTLTLVSEVWVPVTAV